MVVDNIQPAMFSSYLVNKMSAGLSYKNRGTLERGLFTRGTQKNATSGEVWCECIPSVMMAVRRSADRQQNVQGNSV